MQGARFNLLKLAPQLEEIHERMAGVVIENLPWRRFIERYDRPETLFYLDPPYWSMTKAGQCSPGTSLSRWQPFPVEFAGNSYCR